MSKKMEWKGETGGGRIGQKGLLLLFRFFNVRVGYVILYFIIPFYMLFSRKNCKSIFLYFRKRHGYTRIHSLWATYRNHHLFGQIILDRFAFFAGRRDFQFSIDGKEYFDQVLASDKGGMIMSAHVGNFELMGCAFHQEKKRINVLIFGGEAAVMQDNRTNALSQNSINLIPVSADLSHLFSINDALSKHELVCILADRSINDRKRIKKSFLGEDAFFPLGACKIASRYDVNMLSVFVMKERMTSYKVIVRPLLAIDNGEPSTQIDNAMDNYVSHLEQVVNRYPEQWFNFYDYWKK